MGFSRQAQINGIDRNNIYVLASDDTISNNTQRLKLATMLGSEFGANVIITNGTELRTIPDKPYLLVAIIGKDKNVLFMSQSVTPCSFGRVAAITSDKNSREDR
jgi:hypothetical protein